MAVPVTPHAIWNFAPGPGVSLSQRATRPDPQPDKPCSGRIQRQRVPAGDGRGQKPVPATTVKSRAFEKESRQRNVSRIRSNCVGQLNLAA